MNKAYRRIVSANTTYRWLRDCSHRNQFLLVRFAQTEIFYWDDSPETIPTNGKKVEWEVFNREFKIAIDCEYSNIYRLVADKLFLIFQIWKLFYLVF